MNEDLGSVSVYLCPEDMRKILMAILINGGKTVTEAWNLAINIEEISNTWFDK